MPISHQVDCITTATTHGGSGDRITHLGGKSEKGRVWRLTLAEVIEGILSGKWAFYIEDGGQRRNLVVSINSRGSKYIKAESDASDDSALLQLPECRL
jgi:hypothetical protein